LAKVDAHRITKAKYDEAPELTKEMLDRAEFATATKSSGVADRPWKIQNRR
jgi:hypothetical protein